MSHIDSLKLKKEELGTQSAEKILSNEIEEIRAQAEESIKNLVANFDANRQKSIEAIDNQLIGIYAYIEEQITLEAEKDIAECEVLEEFGNEIKSTEIVDTIINYNN